MNIIKIIILKKAISEHGYIADRYMIHGNTLIKEEKDITIGIIDTKARMKSNKQAQYIVNGKHNSLCTVEQALIYVENAR